MGNESQPKDAAHKINYSLDGWRWSDWIWKTTVKPFSMLRWRRPPLFWETSFWPALFDMGQVFQNSAFWYSQKQKKELHQRIIQLEKDLDTKQALELEIERLRGTLNVVKHMGDEGDLEVLQKAESQFLLIDIIHST